MNLLQLQTRGWWAIDDDATDPNEITSAEMTNLINEAIRDVAKDLNIFDNDTITLTSNVGSLPSDFLKPTRMEDSDGLPLPQIDDINDKDIYSQCWMITDSANFTVYPTSTSVASVTLYYQKYPTELSGSTDIPSSIPAEYHHFIPDQWIKAQYALRKNFLDEYNGLMVLWEDTKRQIRQACKNRRTASMTHKIKDVYGI